MSGPHAEPESEVVGAHRHPDVMAGRHLELSVVTPMGAVLARRADEVVAPGVLGEFCVLPGHIPFLAGLKCGVLTLRSGAARESLAVGTGYVQVGAGDRVRVLVERAVAPGDVDLDAAGAEVREIEAELKRGAGAPGELAALAARLDWAHARIAVVERGRVISRTSSDRAEAADSVTVERDAKK